MSDQNLNKKEAYDLKKLEEEKRHPNARRLNLLKRGVLWGGVFVLIGGSIWGLTRIAPAPDNSGNDEILLDEVSALEWSKGNLESKTILVEYSDFQCPA